MELIAFWRVLWRRWWLVALPALVAFVVTLPSLGDVVSPPVTYRVQMRLSAAVPPEPADDERSMPYEDSVYVPLLASEYVVLNMPHWITSDNFAREVSSLLVQGGLTIPAEELIGSFAADGFHSILTLYVTWDDLNAIRAITDAAVTVLQTRNQAYFPQFEVEAVRVVPLDDMSVDELPPPITVRLMPVFRILVGLAAGVGLALLAEYLDQSIRNRDDVERLGVPVLGEIPRE